MPSEITDILLEKLLVDILADGLTGTVKDYCAWLSMEGLLKYSESLEADSVRVKAVLDALKTKGYAIEGKFDKSEYCISTTALQRRVDFLSDSYSLYGEAKFSPIQYVRSRQEYFLEYNYVNEEDIMDISIATIEAIENAVKYGDGNMVHIDYLIDTNRVMKLNIINNIKEFDLSNEIERGKYSSNTTLMRGIMVMQKLFNHLELQIIDDKKQAHLYSEKKLS
ncbi:MAG: ATP-binding protein [Leptospiraceae bacterium]|nr:ATP-binding protein [Leptospiraceae bacterium]